MLTFKGIKPKKDVGKTTLIPGQHLDRATTWDDQIKICRDNDQTDLALDFFRNRIKEANELGSETKKWGDMKLTELEKEQGGHKIGKVTCKSITKVAKAMCESNGTGRPGRPGPGRAEPARPGRAGPAGQTAGRPAGWLWLFL